MWDQTILTRTSMPMAATIITTWEDNRSTKRTRSSHQFSIKTSKICISRARASNPANESCPSLQSSRIRRGSTSFWVTPSIIWIRVYRLTAGRSPPWIRKTYTRAYPSSNVIQIKRRADRLSGKLRRSNGREMSWTLPSVLAVEAVIEQSHIREIIKIIGFRFRWVRLHSKTAVSLRRLQHHTPLSSNIYYIIEQIKTPIITVRSWATSLESMKRIRRILISISSTQVKLWSTTLPI